MADDEVLALSGFRSFERPATVNALAGVDLAEIPPTDLADAQFGFGALDGAIAAISTESGRFAGPALTISVTPGNGLMIRKALSGVRPGDVLVISACGNRERAVFGFNVAREMVRVGVRAVVVDGVVRDLAGIKALGLAVFARGITPRSGSDPHGRGEINGPVACGGVVVHAGDVVVADCEDGIVVVAAGDWGAVAARARGLLSAGPASKRFSGAARVAELPPAAGLDRFLAKAGFQEVGRSWVADRSARETAGAAGGPRHGVGTRHGG